MDVIKGFFDEVKESTQHVPEEVKYENVSELSLKDKKNERQKVAYLRSQNYWDFIPLRFHVEKWIQNKNIPIFNKDYSRQRDDLYDDAVKYYQDENDNMVLEFRRPSANVSIDFQLVNLSGWASGHQIVIFYFVRGNKKYFSVVDSNGVTKLFKSHTTETFIQDMGVALGDSWNYKDLKFPAIQTCELSLYGNKGGCVTWAMLTVDMVARFKSFDAAKKGLLYLEKLSRSRNNLLGRYATSFMADYATYVKLQFERLKPKDKRESTSWKTARALVLAVEGLSEAFESVSYEEAKSIIQGKSKLEPRNTDNIKTLWYQDLNDGLFKDSVKCIVAVSVTGARFMIGWAWFKNSKKTDSPWTNWLFFQEQNFSDNFVFQKNVMDVPAAMAGNHYPLLRQGMIQKIYNILENKNPNLRQYHEIRDIVKEIESFSKFKITSMKADTYDTPPTSLLSQAWGSLSRFFDTTPNVTVDNNGYTF